MIKVNITAYTYELNGGLLTFYKKLGKVNQKKNKVKFFSNCFKWK